MTLFEQVATIVEADDLGIDHSKVVKHGSSSTSEHTSKCACIRIDIKINIINLTLSVF
jgi:hypothetical protein